MNRDCTNQQAPVRLLAVGDPEAARLLSRLLRRCGHRVGVKIQPEQGFLLVPPGQIPWSAPVEYTLLADSLHELESIPCPFRYLAVEYETAVCVPPGAQVVSYSVNSPGADVCARNIRTQENGVVFELQNGGVMARVALPKEEQIRPALVAVLAATRCGIPFARVADELNEIPRRVRYDS